MSCNGGGELGDRLDFTRAAWFVPAFFLNVLFLGTSHAMRHLPLPYWEMYAYLTAKSSLAFGGNVQEFYDIASLVLSVALVVLSYWAFRDRGWPKATVLVLQIASLSFIPLGLEVLLFDYKEWFLHVTWVQAEYNIVPWFTNADFFFVVVAVFGMTLYLRRDSIHWRPLGKQVHVEVEGS